MRDAPVPPLIKGYPRAGAWICGEPGWIRTSRPRTCSSSFPCPASIHAAPGTSYVPRRSAEVANPLSLPRFPAALPRAEPGYFFAFPGMGSKTSGFPRRVLRFLRLLLHAGWALALATFAYPRGDQVRRAQLLGDWSRKLLEILNIKLIVKGKPPKVPGQRVVVVGNHVSWLDVFAVDSVCPSRFVAKSEIRKWPVAGWLAARAGTLFIDRGRRHATARTNMSIIEAIRAGDCVALYPEGSTTDGTLVKPFHASLLQPAVDAGATVHTASLRYLDAEGRFTMAAAYIDNMSLLRSVLQIIREPMLTAELTFGEPIRAEGMDRRELARVTEEATARSLGLPPPHRQPGKPSGPPA